jgi:hypothetical protein
MSVVEQRDQLHNSSDEELRFHVCALRHRVSFFSSFFTTTCTLSKVTIDETIRNNNDQ